MKKIKRKIYLIPPGTFFWSIQLQETVSCDRELFVRVDGYDAISKKPIFGKLQLQFQNIYLHGDITYVDKHNGDISVDFSKCTLFKEDEVEQGTETVRVPKKRLGVYPGSFNPFSIGHLDILEKAEKIFDEVVIAVGNNPEKKSEINVVGTLKRNLIGKKIEGYDGFLIDYVYKKESEGYDVTIVRGLRNGSDLDYEINILRVLEDQNPSVKMIFIPCDRGLGHVSSSMIRGMELIASGSASEYIVKPEMLTKHVSLVEKYDLTSESAPVSEIAIQIKKYDRVECLSHGHRMNNKENGKTFDSEIAYAVADIGPDGEILVYGASLYLDKKYFKKIDNFEFKSGDVIECLENGVCYTSGVNGENFKLNKKYLVKTIGSYSSSDNTYSQMHILTEGSTQFAKPFYFIKVNNK